MPDPLHDPLEEFVQHSRAELVRAGLQRMELDGTVYFRGAANGPALMLLHGVNDQAGTWAPVVPALAAQTRLLVPDLPGHGDSAPAEGPIAMSMMLERLHAIVECEGITRLVLAGNSMGGWLSILYALAHPDRVQALVLEDSSGMPWALSVPLIANSREDAVTMYRAVNGPHAEVPEWAIDSLLKRAAGSPMLRVMMSNVVPHLVSDAQLGSLRAPTTLVWGKDDGVLPTAYAEALQKKIPGARLEVIAGAAHIPHRQQPERFVECLTATF
jgi:pimeloyl-ACP methyl ester carboxylesterase